MAALTTNTVVVAGTAPTFETAASGGDTAEVGVGLFLVARNGHSSEDRTVTIAGQGTTVYGEDNPDTAVTIQEEEEAWIPLHPAYNSGDGTAAITYSDSAADVTVAVVKLPI